MHPLIEMATTAIESLLSLGSIAAIAGKRYKGKTYGWLLFLFTIIMVCFVSLLNAFSAFSFLTILSGIVYLVFVTKFLTNGRLLLRLTACIITYFFLHSMDYIIGFASAMFIGNSSSVYQGFDVLMHQPNTRLIYTLINKSLQTLLFFLLHPYMHYIGQLSKRMLFVLFFIITAAYVVMSSLVQMIIMDSLMIMQIAVLFSWTFIMIGMLACIFTIVLSNRYQQEKTRIDLAHLANRLMERNYRELSAQQTVLAKKLHDFTNHLKTIEHLSEGSPKAQSYISELLSSTYQNVRRCRSGNDVIDAILNCKAEEAEKNGVLFTYCVHLSETLRIPSVDLCAVLANQLDNALEACQSIPNGNPREIHVVIEQKNNFLFLRVENTVAYDPFDKHGHLISAKQEGSVLHGLGLKNIADTVDKHGGTLQNIYQNGMFISFAIMQNTI